LTLENNEGRPFLVADEIRKLKELVDEGVLTQAEFDTQKTQLLAIGYGTRTQPNDRKLSEVQLEDERPIGEYFSERRSEKKKIAILAIILAAVVLAAGLLVYYLFLRGPKANKEERMIVGTWRPIAFLTDSGYTDVHDDAPLILTDNLTGTMSLPGYPSADVAWKFDVIREGNYCYDFHLGGSYNSDVLAVYIPDRDSLAVNMGGMVLLYERN
jgi:hypothetical protein